MPFPFHLALTRYAPRMRRQEGEVLAFEQGGIKLLKSGTVLRQWAYPEIHRLQYHHFPTALPRAFQFMSGGLFQRREAHFRLEAGEQEQEQGQGQGQGQEFWLETNLEFRVAELKALFGELYGMGVRLEEYSASGNGLWLLERAGRDEIARRRGDLDAGNS